MNNINGLDLADSDLKFVLKVPADRAAALRDELLSMGVLEQSIETKDPLSKTDEDDDDNVGDATTTTEELRRRCRLRRPRVRILPDVIKLGTYAGGRYDVVLRRRTVPDGRETVWMTMATRGRRDGGGGELRQPEPWFVAKTTATAATETADLRQDNGHHPATNGHHPVTDVYHPLVTDIDRTAAAATMLSRQCHCADTECDYYKKVLREHFVGRYDDGDGCSAAVDCCGGGRDQVKCVYKEIVGVLFVADRENGTSGDGDGGGGNEDDAVDDHHVVSVAVVPADGQRQPPPESESGNSFAEFVSSTRLDFPTKRADRETIKIESRLSLGSRFDESENSQEIAHKLFQKYVHLTEASRYGGDCTVVEAPRVIDDSDKQWWHNSTDEAEAAIVTKIAENTPSKKPPKKKLVDKLLWRKKKKT